MSAELTEPGERSPKEGQREPGDVGMKGDQGMPGDDGADGVDGENGYCDVISGACAGEPGDAGPPGDPGKIDIRLLHEEPNTQVFLIPRANYFLN